MLNLGELAQMAAGAGLGLAILIAYVFGIAGFIRANERRQAQQQLRAIALYALSAGSGLLALAGIAYGLSIVARGSPLG